MEGNRRGVIQGEARGRPCQHVSTLESTVAPCEHSVTPFPYRLPRQATGHPILFPVRGTVAERSWKAMATFIPSPFHPRRGDAGSLCYCDRAPSSLLSALPLFLSVRIWDPTSLDRCGRHDRRDFLSYFLLFSPVFSCFLVNSHRDASQPMTRHVTLF